MPGEVRWSESGRILAASPVLYPAFHETSVDSASEITIVGIDRGHLGTDGDTCRVHGTVRWDPFHSSLGWNDE